MAELRSYTPKDRVRFPARALLERHLARGCQPVCYAVNSDEERQVRLLHVPLCFAELNEGPLGVEPSWCRLTGDRNPGHAKDPCFKMQGRKDSNLQPLGSEPTALRDCATPL